MLTAFVLTALAVLFREFSSTLSRVELRSVGSDLPLRRISFTAPMGVDCSRRSNDDLRLFLDQERYRPAFELTRWTIYATFAVTTLLGPLANWPRFGRWLLPVLSVTGSTVFFVTSNLATWGEGLLYPMTFAGLICVLCRGNSVLRQYDRGGPDGYGRALRARTRFRTCRPECDRSPDGRGRSRNNALPNPGRPDPVQANHVANCWSAFDRGTKPWPRSRGRGRHRRQGAAVRLTGSGDTRRLA